MSALTSKSVTFEIENSAFDADVQSATGGAFDSPRVCP